jgi:proteic killer suppression protein
MIQSFADKDTETLWRTERSKRHAAIARVTLRKLIQLNAAECLEDVRMPPGNHLEALAGDRKGQYSMRINSKWRICFVWTAAGPDQVQIEDYH